MAEQTTTQTKGKRGRSPNYPGIPLGEALERARTLYNAERKNAVPVDAILSHWGYSPKSGPGWSVLAALKKFGLLVDEGSGPNRKARLSDEALAIILDEREDSTERSALIRQAALKPALHATLRKEFPDTLPTDASLRFKLLREHGFTENGATEFIREFRNTLAYAGLLDGGKLSDEDEDSGEPESEDLMGAATATLDQEKGSPPPPGKAQAKVIQLPIAPEEWAALQAAFPLTEEKWMQMLAVLTAMKPALVRNDEANGRPSDPGPEGSD